MTIRKGFSKVWFFVSPFLEFYTPKSPGLMGLKLLSEVIPESLQNTLTEAGTSQHQSRGYKSYNFPDTGESSLAEKRAENLISSLFSRQYDQ